MSTEIAVSVIVPVYNAARDLRRCLDSLLAQTLLRERPMEILVIDDGSTDRSHAIALDVQRREPDIIRVIRKENGGLSSARNAGMSAARGKYIGFIDSDDWIEREMYGELYRACESSNADMAVCRFVFDGVRRAPSEDMGAQPRVYEADEIRGVLLPHMMDGHSNYIIVVNKLYRRAFLEEQGIRFPETIRYAEDVHFSPLCLGRCARLVTVPKAFYHYVSRPGSLSHTYHKDLRAQYLYIYERISEFRREFQFDTQENRRIHAQWWTSLLRMLTLREYMKAANSGDFRRRMISLAEEPILREVLELTRKSHTRDRRNVPRYMLHLFSARDWAGMKSLMRRELWRVRAQGAVRWLVYHARLIFFRGKTY
ncbi:MAG: glycosyltransferase [Oscillospiraceae bacterium]|nr:glycosyltransferase [Oscillospiraceae bacterium]